jgi:hypothetical protein
MRTGIAQVPLHHGRAPRWLFERMVKLSGAIIESIITQNDVQAFLKRLSDPFWFQAFGSILGFDWHSSGITTTVCGAMKESTKHISRELGIFFCGGKGRTSRKTPREIENIAQQISIEPENLIYASKTAAKVDNTCVQDGYNLYHHMFVFTEKGDWCVIQQGMNPVSRYARRYHWLSLELESYVNEPHNAVCCDKKVTCLNMVAQESEDVRSLVTELAREKPEKIIRQTKKILCLPQRHPVLNIDINPGYFSKILLKTYESAPDNFEHLLSIKGVGPKTIRALALISELIYGKAPSFQDPARYSFAHGGKDGFPYPVDKSTYDSSIDFLEKAIKKSRLGENDKFKVLKKLAKII